MITTVLTVLAVVFLVAIILGVLTGRLPIEKGLIYLLCCVVVFVAVYFLLGQLG